jgi:hypothetical protein
MPQLLRLPLRLLRLSRRFHLCHQFFFGRTAAGWAFLCAKTLFADLVLWHIFVSPGITRLSIIRHDALALNSGLAAHAPNAPPPQAKAHFAHVQGRPQHRNLWLRQPKPPDYLRQRKPRQPHRHYAYDALDRRIAKTVGGALTSYIYDTSLEDPLAFDDITLEFEGTATPILKRRWLHSDAVDEPVGFDEAAQHSRSGRGKRTCLSD